MIKRIKCTRNGIKKYFKHDFYNGIVFEWKKYAVFFFYIFCLCFRFFFIHCDFVEYGSVETKLSFGDYLMYILKGMKLYVPNSSEIYIPDFTWILIVVYIAFVINSYPLKDLYGYGQMMLIRSKKRCFWWISKCLWIAFSICFFYVMILLNCFIFGLISGSESMMPHKNIQMYFSQINISMMTNEQFIIEVFIVPLIVMIMLSLLQTTLNIIWGPVIGFVVIVSIYTLSIYSSEIWMFGNYLMLMRNKTFNYGTEINSLNGFILSIILIFVSIIFGYLKFKKIDILTNGE